MLEDTVHCVLPDEKHVSPNLVHFKNWTELISPRLALISVKSVWNAKQP